mmetsp:Transcript_4268/g.7713  ORF Transcript_4268/g.7713 Transcript_4268/m.7713 type:complete len:344 (-) Transcript_4268:259-1290(-)
MFQGHHHGSDESREVREAMAVAFQGVSVGRKELGQHQIQRGVGLCHGAFGGDVASRLEIAGVRRGANGVPGRENIMLEQQVELLAEVLFPVPGLFCLLAQHLRVEQQRAVNDFVLVGEDVVEGLAHDPGFFRDIIHRGPLQPVARKYAQSRGCNLAFFFGEGGHARHIHGVCRPVNFAPTPVGPAQVLVGLLGEKRLDRGGCDHQNLARVRIFYVQATLYRSHRRVTARQLRRQNSAINLFWLLHADGHLHAHILVRQAGGVEHRDRGVADRVLDRARGGLGVILTILVVAHAHFDDKTLLAHVVSPRSSATEIATFAITVGLPPSSRGTSSPPLRGTTVTCP